MKLIHLTLAVLAVSANAAAVAAPKCEPAPKEQWQAKEALEQKLVAEGVKVKRIKVDQGCYEVYGTDAKGNRIEQYFDPRTFEPVK